MDNIDINNISEKLICACDNGDFNEIKILVEQGANINYKNSVGDYALIKALDNDNKFEIVKYLIEHGADLNICDRYNLTPLNILFDTSDDVNMDILNYLVEHGADVNYVDNSSDTPLMYASGKFMVEPVEYFIKKGANINYVNKKGYTPLMVACDSGFNVDIVKYLVDHGANINSHNNEYDTPLLKACLLYECDNFEYVKYLVDHGAYVNCVNNHKETPLTYLMHHFGDGYNNEKSAKYLIDHGALLSEYFYKQMCKYASYSFYIYILNIMRTSYYDILGKCINFTETYLKENNLMSRKEKKEIINTDIMPVIRELGIFNNL